jgi:hypothetical protein
MLSLLTLLNPATAYTTTTQLLHTFCLGCCVDLRVVLAGVVNAIYVECAHIVLIGPCGLAARVVGISLRLGAVPVASAVGHTWPAAFVRHERIRRKLGHSFRTVAPPQRTMAAVENLLVHIV